MNTGTLYIVSTPIGNLEDITLRAIRILKEVDAIAAEDTRHTQKLLNKFDIHTPLTSYHDHNKEEKAPVLVARLLEGDELEGAGRIAVVPAAPAAGRDTRKCDSEG